MPRVLIMNASTLQTATVAATAFAGKTRVQQHRMVHAALKGHVNNNVAVAIQTVVAEK